jgi:type I restriction enzyme S subunit
MSANWPTIALRDLCSIARGGSPRPIKNFITDDPDGINWIKIGDTQKGGRYIDSTAEKIKPEGIARSRFVEAGSFLLSNSMSFGRPYILRTSGCIHDGWLVLEPDYERVNQDFLYHVLGSRTVFDQFDRLAAGSTVRNLNIGLVEGVEIPLPPLEEQQRIVAILDEAFEGLARARAHAEANLQNARELFDQELGQIFSSGKQDWTMGTVEELCLIRSGTTVPKSQERSAGAVPYVKVADMNLIENIDGIQTSSRFLDESDVSDRKIIPAGATIFPKRGGAIMTNKKRKVLVDICADLNVMGVIPGVAIDEDFLYFFFLSLDMREIGSGSAIPQINNYDINPLLFSYPPDLHEQAQVAETLQILRDQTISLTKSYETKLEDLADLRQSLLQKAFAGELT